MVKRIRQAYQFTLHPALASALEQYVEHLAAQGATIRRSDIVNAGLAAFFEADESERARLLQRGRSVLTGEVKDLLCASPKASRDAASRKRGLARAAARVKRKRATRRQTGTEG
jgi:hypothetical protein